MTHTNPNPSSPTVDAIMVDRRAKSFTTRSIKKDSKMAALEMAVSMIDLTTLEGSDSPVAELLNQCRSTILEHCQEPDHSHI